MEDLIAQLGEALHAAIDQTLQEFVQNAGGQQVPQGQEAAPVDLNAVLAAGGGQGGQGEQA